ncbi:putative centrosomal protein [Neospora caninum Liverpool]|uniref:Centrosomal protein, putative n=1 Tax=Neospora caninum (strain Liverpool) TaxID=572307 RepID=F0VR25_NEOCL|nr:putative centrosomal protein [Neospora caninum Liverpool]CBZ56172.1 putative centrosomal protein [Neospora caninum Liverpool]CEL70930.1 TPA: centrosomal protein, putative [Neospora caninum Liverpool]|eukprot:XP_003886198.1 putative centrosomal protein [Neospora caninum Liverpool]
MKNAWSAFRGAVQEFNAVLLSEDEEDDEEEEGEEELLGEGSVDDQHADHSTEQHCPASQTEDSVKTLKLRLHQEEQRRLFVERRLQQAEKETAEHTQLIVDLRNQCRLLRGPRGGPSSISTPRDAAAAAFPPPDSDLFETASLAGSPLIPLSDLRAPVRKLLHALCGSDADSGLPAFPGASRVSKRFDLSRKSSRGVEAGSASSASLPGLKGPDAGAEDSHASSEPEGNGSGTPFVDGEEECGDFGRDAQEALMQLDAACCCTERARGRAEWLLSEWTNLVASPAFQRAASATLAPCLPPSQLEWLESEAAAAASRAVPSAENSSPILDWFALSARLLECLHCLSAENDSAPAVSGEEGRTASLEKRHRRLFLSRQCSIRGSGEAAGSAVADDRGAAGAAACDNDGPVPGDIVAEKQLQDEVRLRQLLQHRISLQERRIHELEDELRNVKEAFEHQVNQTTEAAKKAEDQEAERQAQVQQHMNEALRSVRQQYDSLLQQYERLQTANRKAAQSDETERPGDPVVARSQQLECENRDLLLQVKAWQRAHADVSQSLQAASAELAEHRSHAMKVEALEKELTLSKSELARLSNLQSVQNQSELELIQSHAERDAIEAELNEARRTVESLNKVMEHMQEESDAMLQRLKGEKEQTETEVRQLRRKLRENAGAVTDLSGTREELAEAKTKVTALEEALDRFLLENAKLKDEIEKILERQQKEEDEREYYVDRRLISEMIAKHQALEGQIRRRDEVFLLICDVLQLSEEDRAKIGIRTRKGAQGDQDQGKRLSERFVEFLNEETK